MDEELKPTASSWALTAALFAGVVEMLHWSLVLVFRTLRRIVRL